MKILTRTCYGAYVQACQLMKLAFQLITNTTLNEKFAVQSGIAPASDVIPTVGYYCIGDGGHAVQTGTDGRPYIVPLQHLTTDAALYHHVPFLIRPVASDIDNNTRQAYALRTIITAPNSLQYAAYYLKRLDLTGLEPSMQLNSVVNGVTSIQPFVPTSDNLNPTAPPTSSMGVVTTNGSYITSAALLNLLFSANDVAELINVASILYNNDLEAIISEIGLCTGVDKVVNVDDGLGGELSMNEAIAVQIAVHMTSYYSVGSSNNGVTFNIQVGATEPLYGATNITTSLFTPTP